MRRKGRGEQRRQRRHRPVHQAGKARLHILQNEHAPAGLVLLRAHIGLEDLVGQPGRGLFVAFFRFREIAEQPADADILGLFGGLDVKPLGFELHRPDFLADGVERQILGQPDRTAAQKSLDVVSANGRKIWAETLFVHLQQHVAMAFFLLGHFLEDLGRFRITLRQILREGHVDAAVFLLRGDRNRQHFPLGQIGEILHSNAFLIRFRIVLNLITVACCKVKSFSRARFRSRNLERLRFVSVRVPIFRSIAVEYSWTRSNIA